MKNLKLMISAEEARSISENNDNIDIKILSEQIESDLIDASNNNFILIGKNTPTSKRV